ncbi:hypothetical protein QBC45DRAFT_147578 [Copromyces sp. CBS 386.78]|nr:hypothetical protein QBC45DRAFT_147578 [Copromyces sp. CBS 386.78]
MGACLQLTVGLLWVLLPFNLHFYFTPFCRPERPASFFLIRNNVGVHNKHEQPASQQSTAPSHTISRVLLLSGYSFSPTISEVIKPALDGTFSPLKAKESSFFLSLFPTPSL